MSNDYKEWEGTGSALGGSVYTIDDSLFSIEPISKGAWGSLEDYIPTGIEDLNATRTVKSDDNGEYLEVILSDGWNARLRQLVESLKFRFVANPNYTGVHTSLNKYNILKMDSGDQDIDWDVNEWKPLEGVGVELLRKEPKDSVDPKLKVVYTLKFFFEKIGDENLKVAAFWCWP